MLHIVDWLVDSLVDLSWLVSSGSLPAGGDAGQYKLSAPASKHIGFHVVVWWDTALVCHPLLPCHHRSCSTTRTTRMVALTIAQRRAGRLLCNPVSGCPVAASIARVRIGVVGVWMRGLYFV